MQSLRWVENPGTANSRLGGANDRSIRMRSNYQPATRIRHFRDLFRIGQHTRSDQHAIAKDPRWGGDAR
jgi:hypothetical protein